MYIYLRSYYITFSENHKKAFQTSPSQYFGYLRVGHKNKYFVQIRGIQLVGYYSFIISYRPSYVQNPGTTSLACSQREFPGYDHFHNAGSAGPGLCF